MQLRQLWLTDFRGYEQAELEFAPGLTAVVGSNGHGKTNLLEAIGYLATLQSFRGAPTEAMVRTGATQAVVRADCERSARDLLIEAEIVPNGRNRIQVNRQKLPRARDLLGALRITVFAPDDLSIIKGSPGERRGYLDDTLVAIHPNNQGLRAELEKVLRQRNALLKQVRGRLDEAATVTLEVWDAKLVELGTRLTEKRLELIRRIEPVLAESYANLAQHDAQTTIRYESAWLDRGLAAALVDARADELRRGSTLVGPQRDDVYLAIDGLAARTHASQGEQRSMALALRLASHRVVTDVTDAPPVLLLDDVFSELDAGRSLALTRSLPACQTILTSAAGIPEGSEPERIVHIADGRIVPGEG